MNQTTFNFPQIVNRTNEKAELVTNTKSINVNLGLLLRTRPGELLGDPEYGCNLIDEIFKYNGVIVESLIKEDIIDAITKYEPRITVTYNDIQLVKTVQILHIFIQYVINSTGEVNQYNLDINSDEVKNRTI